MFFIVSSPIGNLGDCSERAAQILRAAERIYCEDTRHSKPWLDRLGCSAPLISLHQHNEQSRTDEILERLRQGQKLALVSDAGVPGICDPGQAIIRAVRAADLPLTVIPGPCAFITAWSLLGWELPLQFIGFMPRDGADLAATLIQALEYRGATLCYESPKRVLKTVQLIAQLAPMRRCAVARELTKIHEEIIELPAQQLALEVAKTPIRGELVLAIAPAMEQQHPLMQSLSIPQRVALLQDIFKCDRSSAMKLLAQLCGQTKRDIYQALLAHGS